MYTSLGFIKTLFVIHMEESPISREFIKFLHKKEIHHRLSLKITILTISIDIESQEHIQKIIQYLGNVFSALEDAT